MFPHGSAWYRENQPGGVGLNAHQPFSPKCPGKQLGHWRHPAGTGKNDPAGNGRSGAESFATTGNPEGKDRKIDTYTIIYQFAASAGALEGYVYRKSGPADLDLPALADWIGNLEKAYHHLPDEVRNVIQADLDRTLGRAFHSLKTALGGSDELVVRLAGMIRDRERMPTHPDDFTKRKWFDESS